MFASFQFNRLGVPDFTQYRWSESWMSKSVISDFVLAAVCLKPLLQPNYLEFNQANFFLTLLETLFKMVYTLYAFHLRADSYSILKMCNRNYGQPYWPLALLTGELLDNY